MNNERIRELTFKASAKLYSEPPKEQVTGVSMSFESVEKFAELIISECIENDELDDTDRKHLDVLRKMFTHTLPDRFPDTYFICGDGGDKDDRNLPEYVFVVPAYGVGYSVPYKRVDNYD